MAAHQPSLAERPDIPVLYSAVRVGARGPHRRVRPRSARHVGAAAAPRATPSNRWSVTTRGFAHVEMRYRLLFQMSSEAILIVDAATQRVTEANPAARAICSGRRASAWSGGRCADAFDAEARRRSKRCSAGCARPAEAEDVACASRARTREEVAVSPSMFRQEGTCASCCAFPRSAARGRARPPFPTAQGEAAEAGRERAGRLRASPTRRAGSSRPTPRSSTWRSSRPRTGARRAARPLVRPARRRLQRPDRQSAPARLGPAVRDHPARRVRRAASRSRSRPSSVDERRPAVLRLRDPQRRPATERRSPRPAANCRARSSS